MTYHVHDAESDSKRSLMRRARYLCNGEQTGLQCQHYWHSVVPLDVLNAVALKQGETNRQCLRHPGVEIRLTAEDGGPPEMATYCNQYAASDRAFDPELETFNPLSPEEIEALRDGPELGPDARGLVTIGSKNPSVLARLRAFFHKE